MMRRIAALAAGLLALGVLAPAGGQSPRELIEQGNAHYAAGRYAEALKAYEEAASGPGGQTPELLHNLAAAHFKLGQIEQARDLWARTKELPDAALEARSRYNLGNCDYADALTAAQAQDGQRALQKLEQAAAQYRTALRLDPTLTDARANLELTQLLRKQIEQQQRNQPQTQSSPTQSQPSQDQEPATQPSQSPEGQQPQTQPWSQSPPPQETTQGQEQQGEPNQPPQSQPAPQTQPVPAQTQPAGEEQQEATTVLTREQAERLLQMIRDAEKARREKLAREQVLRQKPVDRDW